MMDFQPVLLWSDLLVFLLVAGTAAMLHGLRRREDLRRVWASVGASRSGMAALVVLAAYLAIGLLDSLHYRPRLPAAAGEAPAYAVEVRSALDAVAESLRSRQEKTYSAPLATRLLAMETLEGAPGQVARAHPRLRHGGAHLGDESARGADVGRRVLSGLAAAAALWLALSAFVARCVARARGASTREGWRLVFGGGTDFAWDAVLLTLGALLALVLPLLFLAGDYHVLGTDKVGQDVFYQSLKSVRTALLIGTLTTLVTLPVATLLGIAAGYFGGWVDDAIQYVYTTLNSIPGVLLIAAAVLMMQVLIETHPQWFATSAERADLRLLALCFILGMTSWTGLARLLRGETLKLRELEYVQAARAFGVGHGRIIGRHILPNLMHIVIIALVMDFSGLVLAEAVLSYVGIGVDPGMMSFGTMINAARLELAREPVVWWSLAAAFSFMFVLVLAANLFSDAVRDAFDPRLAGRGEEVGHG